MHSPTLRSLLLLTLAACSGAQSATPTLPTPPPTSDRTNGGGSDTGGGGGGGGSIPAYTTQNGNILAPDSNTLVFVRGITWDGFATDPNGLLAGLNQGTDSLTGDFPTQVLRLQALGFNSVRLPFNFGDLNTLTPNAATTGCTVVTAAAVQANLTNPSVAAQGNFPALAAPVMPTPAGCNSTLPKQDIRARLTYVVQFLLANDFAVILTNSAANDSSIQADPNGWVNQWAMLVAHLATDANTQARLWVDPLDEPDRLGLGWEADSSGFPGMGAQYLAVMQAVLGINPATLFFLQGTGQAAAGANPGDGFVADSAQISSQKLSSPRAFFTNLAAKPFVNQVVLAPHVAPPSVTGNAGDANTALWTRLNQSFGPYNRAGLVTNAGTVVLPVMVVLGSNMAAGDQGAMRSLASYLNDTAPAQDNIHNPITSWAWQAWNTDHSGTGGIVDTHWELIVWDKINYLTGTQPYPTPLGLHPWYLPQ